jgi:hypothetical protein
MKSNTDKKWEKELNKIILLWISPDGDEFKGSLGSACNDKAIPNFISDLLLQSRKEWIKEIKKIDIRNPLGRYVAYEPDEDTQFNVGWHEALKKVLSLLEELGVKK